MSWQKVPQFPKQNPRRQLGASAVCGAHSALHCLTATSLTIVSTQRPLLQQSEFLWHPVPLFGMQGLGDGFSVGSGVGSGVGFGDGSRVGSGDGSGVGSGVGSVDSSGVGVGVEGFSEGIAVGSIDLDGSPEGLPLGIDDRDGLLDVSRLGRIDNEGFSEGIEVGSIDADA
jgi:hypothetical protein